MATVEPTAIDTGVDIALLPDTTKAAPRTFDPAALFLLDLSWPNMFERIDRDALVYRCKGCGDEVRFSKRERHFKGHKRNRDRLAKQAARQYRDTDSKSTAPDTESGHRKEKDMSTIERPKVKKTEVARNAALAALKQIGRQATMAEIIGIASKDAKVKSAGVPDSTIAAQVNFELAEKTPRIVRVSRGVYATKGNEKKPLPETATASRSGSTSGTGSKSKSSSKSSTKAKSKTKSRSRAAVKKSAAKKSSASGRSSSRSSVQVTPHPKPGRA